MKRYFIHKKSGRFYESNQNTDNFMEGLLKLIQVGGSNGILVNKDTLIKHYAELNNIEVANLLFTKED